MARNPANANMPHNIRIPWRSKAKQLTVKGSHYRHWAQSQWARFGLTTSWACAIINRPLGNTERIIGTVFITPGAPPALFFEASLSVLLLFLVSCSRLPATQATVRVQHQTLICLLVFLPSFLLFLPYLATNKTKNEPRRRRRKIRNHIQLDGYQ